MNPVITAIFSTLLEAGISERTFNKIFDAIAIADPTVTIALYIVWYHAHNGGMGENDIEGGK